HIGWSAGLLDLGCEENKHPRYCSGEAGVGYCKASRRRTSIPQLYLLIRPGKDATDVIAITPGTSSRIHIRVLVCTSKNESCSLVAYGEVNLTPFLVNSRWSSF